MEEVCDGFGTFQSAEAYACTAVVFAFDEHNRSME